MTTRVKLVFACFIACQLMACGSGGNEQSPDPIAPPPPAPQPETSLEDAITEQVSRIKSEDNSALTVLIRHNNETVYQLSTGIAQESIQAPSFTTTAFNLASVSKPFTAIAVMQLQENMLLNLNDSVLDYVPELPESWQNINIHQLLSHQSGIYDFLNDQDVLQFDDELIEGLTNSRLIEYFISDPELEFEPGTRSEYSNTGYVLLAEVIEEASSMPFQEYMDTFVFQPAEMTFSFVQRETGLPTEDLALNWGVVEQVYGYHLYATGSDSQFSSMDDFIGFFDAMTNSSLISDESLAQMTELHSRDIGYGYGFAITNKGTSTEAWRHTGELDGYRSLLAIYPNDNIQMVVLGNGGPMTTRLYQNIEQTVLDFYRGNSTHTTGSGNVAMQTRILESFDEVEVLIGNVEINDCPAQVTISFDDNLIDSVSTLVQDNRLVIGFNGSYSSETPLDIEICSEQLHRLRTSGTGNVIVNRSTTAQLVNYNGVGSLVLNDIRGTESQFIVSGVGEVTAFGSVETLNLRVSGVSQFNGRQLTANTTEIEKSGTGTVILTSDRVTGNLGGIGNLFVNASAIVEVTTSGIARVIRESN